MDCGFFSCPWQAEGALCTTDPGGKRLPVSRAGLRRRDPALNSDMILSILAFVFLSTLGLGCVIAPFLKKECDRARW